MLLLRNFEKNRVIATTAFCGALLLLTTPEIAFWSRDTMSEIPGLALILADVIFFSLARYREYTRLHCGFLFGRGRVPIPLPDSRSPASLVLVGVTHGQVPKVTLTCTPEFGSRVSDSEHGLDNLHATVFTIRNRL